MSSKTLLPLFLMSIILIATKPAFATPINLHILSNGSWKSSSALSSDWQTINYNDSGWVSAKSPYPHPNTPTDLIPGTTASFIWHDPTSSSTDGASGAVEAFFRYTFFLDMQPDSLPIIAQALVQVDDDYDLYVNGILKIQNHDEGYAGIVNFLDFTSLLLNGKNVIAIHAKDGGWSNAHNRTYEDVLFDGVVKTVASAPEPSSPLLLLSGIFGLAWLRKFKFDQCSTAA